MTELITLKNVSKEFVVDHKKIRALDDINLTVNKNEFLVLVGPSGSGKSTILRILSGLEKDFSGSMKADPSLELAPVGFVFQQFALLPWLTVYQNVEFNLLSSHLTPTERHEAIMEELKKLGLEQFAQSKPKNLSGGMRQRVGLARALVRQPTVLFLDEPFSELDSFTAEELREELLKIWRERGLTVVMVTHIIEDAIELADRIAVLDARPGHISRIVQNLLPRPRKKRSEPYFKMEDELVALIKKGSTN